MTSALSIALKEWDVLCAALLAGEQAILLRKGGIYEAAGEFELEHRQFLLFPTFVHQDPRGVKPAWRPRVRRLSAEPRTISLAGWAEVHSIVQVPDRARMEALDDLHLWDAPLLDMRFGYRPEKPLYLMVVRAYRLSAPVVIANSLAYAGCKSWVPLEGPVDISASTAALPERRIADLAERVRSTFA